MSKKSKELTGIVHFGYIGEYKKPPCYIIRKGKYQKRCRNVAKKFLDWWFSVDEVFIDDFMRQFAEQKVQITVKKLH